MRGFLGRLRNDPTQASLATMAVCYFARFYQKLELAKHDSCGSRTLSNTHKNFQVDQHFYRDNSIVN